MAEKKQQIVIKKIYVVAAGHHGGSWKVALADFMTALMAFFLVMWLLGANAETKKAISDYFSTPSVIEYNFQNFGAEITLEKLFLDLVNEPIKAIQSFVEPADKTPNILDFGSSKVIMSFVVDQLHDYAKNIEFSEDSFEFEISDKFLFEKGSSKPMAEFVKIMEKLVAVTTGLEDSDMTISSRMFVTQVSDSSPRTAVRVASERLDMVKAKIMGGLENLKTVSVFGKVDVKNPQTAIEKESPEGFIKIKVKQKPVKANGKAPTPISVSSGRSKGDPAKNEKSLLNDPTGSVEQHAKFGKVQGLKNPVEEEMIKEDSLSNTGPEQPE